MKKNSPRPLLGSDTVPGLRGALSPRTGCKADTVLREHLAFVTCRLAVSVGRVIHATSFHLLSVPSSPDSIVVVPPLST